MRALDGVSLTCAAARFTRSWARTGASAKVHCLKFSLEMYQPSAGQILLNDRPIHFTSPAHAFASGVAVIYQELHLVDYQSVAENIYLGHLPATGGWVRWKPLRESAKNLLESLGEKIDPRAKSAHWHCHRAYSGRWRKSPAR